MPFCINLLICVASGQQLKPGCATGDTLPCHYEQGDPKRRSTPMDGTIPWEGTLSAHLLQLPEGLGADGGTAPCWGHCPQAVPGLGLSRKMFQGLATLKTAAATQGNTTLRVCSGPTAWNNGIKLTFQTFHGVKIWYTDFLQSKITVLTCFCL